MPDAVLNSWKDIAGHLHTSVRTAQRWEMYFGLPIHRPSGTHKGPVLAFEKELDQWIQAGGAARAAAQNGHSETVAQNGHSKVPASLGYRYPDIRPRVLTTMDRAERTRQLAFEISQRAQELREQLARALAIREKSELRSRTSGASSTSST